MEFKARLDNKSQSLTGLSIFSFHRLPLNSIELTVLLLDTFRATALCDLKVFAISKAHFVTPIDSCFPSNDFFCFSKLQQTWVRSTPAAGPGCSKAS